MSYNVTLTVLTIDGIFGIEKDSVMAELHLRADIRQWRKVIHCLPS
jgi:hypothetical protein